MENHIPWSSLEPDDEHEDTLCQMLNLTFHDHVAANHPPPGLQVLYRSLPTNQWASGPGESSGSAASSLSGMGRSSFGNYGIMNNGNSNGNGDYFDYLMQMHQSPPINPWASGPGESSGSSAFGVGESSFGTINNVFGGLRLNGRGLSINHNPCACPKCSVNQMYNNDNVGMNKIRFSTSWNTHVSIGNGDRASPVSKKDYIYWDNLKGKVAMHAKDQIGTRKLQKTLGHLTPYAMSIVISEVIYNVKDIMNSQFGTKFFQELVDCCNDYYITHLLHAVMGKKQDFLEISVHVFGTRAIQKLVKRLDVNNQEQKRIVSSVLKQEDVTLILAKDTRGQHVVLELVKVFRGANDLIKLVVEEMAYHVAEIAMSKSGCCVLPQCADIIEAGLRDRLINAIILYATQLSRNEFGNYVVQVALEKFDNKYTSQVINSLKGAFANLTTNKYGSHVVERCLILGNDEEVAIIVIEILNDEHFDEIPVDPYGNFVIQKAIVRSKAMLNSKHPWSTYKILKGKIMIYYPSLHSHPFGRRVLTTIKKHIYRDD